MKWERIDDVLNARGKRELKAGQVLLFDYDGSPIHLKIMRKTKDGKVWAKRTHLYTHEEMKNEVQIVEVDDAVRLPENK